MKKSSSVRSSFVFLLLVVLTTAVGYHTDVVGRAAYAYERGKLQADFEHLDSIDAADVATLEKLSHSFSVIAAAAKPSVVHVQANTLRTKRLLERLPEGMRERVRRSPRVGTGSGVIIDTEGHIVTNNHVVAGAESVFVTLEDGHRLEAEVVGTDPPRPPRRGRRERGQAS